MHQSDAPYSCCLFKTDYSSGYDHVFGNVRGLHCTQLVPHARASSDDVDVSHSGEWIHLKRGIVPWRAWPNRSTWTTYHAPQWESIAVWKSSARGCLAGIEYGTPELGYDDLDLGSRLGSWSPTVTLYINSGKSKSQLETFVKFFFLLCHVDVLIMIIRGFRKPHVSRATLLEAKDLGDQGKMKEKRSSY
ncbi:hypothetical protein M9H77_22517 [Catharanthus roseus]|uniref:Uncharacterized protein n=1 Tax=Catharanthus roseus TaxID=4058 RepID=A0ACC0AST9_CATRO|nr:hypothetical protein M9H77_22517 [Catharanthus roseus]